MFYLVSKKKKNIKRKMNERLKCQNVYLFTYSWDCTQGPKPPRVRMFLELFCLIVFVKVSKDWGGCGFNVQYNKKCLLQREKLY